MKAALATRLLVEARPPKIRQSLGGPGAPRQGMSTAARNSWEHFAHGADIGIRGIAPTKEGAFEQSASTADPVDSATRLAPSS